VDDDRHQRLLDDRINVQFETTDVAIDIVQLKAFADGELERRPLEQLEDAAARYGGCPLDGLELPNFHDFGAWCIGERETATLAQSSILGVLIQRLAADPARALPHARALVRNAPYDEKARAPLIGILVALGRLEQAEQQYQVERNAQSLAMPTGEMCRAWRGASGSPAAGIERKTAATYSRRCRQRRRSAAGAG
jgi:DNA-binding SARP family transcriptional activator